MTILIFDILLVFLLGGFSAMGASSGIDNNWILLDEFHTHYTKDFENAYNGQEGDFDGIDCDF